MTGPVYNFMGLFPRAIACLQLGSESLKKVLRILECYLILDPVGLLQVCTFLTCIANSKRYSEPLFNAISEFTQGLKADAHRAVMTVLEVAIQGCPLHVYFTRFVSSGLFVQILAAVMNDNVSAPR